MTSTTTEQRGRPASDGQPGVPPAGRPVDGRSCDIARHRRGCGSRPEGRGA